MSGDLAARIRHVTAVLGPTNTGKTHLAIERMLGHESGIIGLPLRLLAREVYDRIGKKVGYEAVALVTGEEKIKPPRARYWVSTVEAMPRELDVDFLAIDEVQLAADPERGHIFTDRLLHARGRSETLLLGAQTMRDVIQALIPGANFVSRPRLSKLTYGGPKKITRLPTRSAVVAFSANEVYSIAELIRRQRGGAAVVLGALSPRTRNAQVALYQSGDVDFLVATDAIGMGLNLDVDHVAFSAVRKFDGQQHRDLTPSELAQIAGRAGRHLNDGTFGVTGSAEAFNSDLIENLETHQFEAVRLLQWRNTKLEFSSLDRLRESLKELPQENHLARARASDDLAALDLLSSDDEIRALACAPAAVVRLWDVCQVPDYRKISTQNHADIVGSLYKFLMRGDEKIPEDWFAGQVAYSERTDGDIDTLANRIAHIRTWTFVANRSDWLKDPQHWQGKTREIEDRLSDALHEKLTQRFVDRRTSALMKGMRDKDELETEIRDGGEIHVENHFVGKLEGFCFSPAPQAEGIHGKAMRNAAAQVVGRELEMRTRRVSSAKAEDFSLTTSGFIQWKGETVARAEASDDALCPSVNLIADEHLSAADREKVQSRLMRWMEAHISERLKPLVDISNAEDVTGLARGIGFRLKENFGVLSRESASDEIKALDQPARAQLRKYGVRFGAFNVYLPLLLKPAAAELALTLWALKYASEHKLDCRALPAPPRAGLTSAAVEKDLPDVFYRVAGYHVCGPRAVRVDMLERLADQIRSLLSWRAKDGCKEVPPKGATGDGAFRATPEMMSILGCSSDELGDVLSTLGFRKERRPIKVKPEEPSKAFEKIEPNEDASASVPENGAGDMSQAVTISSGGGEAPKSLSDGTVSEFPQQADVATDSSQEAEKLIDEVAANVAVSSTDASNGAQTSTEASAPTSEPEFEEIWRPAKRHRLGGRRKAHGNQRSARLSPRAQTGETTQNQDPASRSDGARGHAASAKGKGDRYDRTTDSGGNGAPQKSNKRGKPPFRDKKNTRRRDGVGGGVFRSAPKSSKGLDPDSPFAALSALKDELEKKN